jgi:plasmid stabilization system protein ParE
VKRFTFTPAARRDVEQITDYLRTIPRAPALRIGRALQRAIETITNQPHLGRIDHRLTERSAIKILRFLSEGYVLFYFIDDIGLCIIGILHGKRDIPSIMEQRIK